MGNFLLAIVIAVLLGALLWWMLSHLYHRARPDVAFVRTGLFGRKVVVTGGTLVIPVLHEVTAVNMNTMRLQISRSNEAALITNDHVRVDADVAFNVRVRGTRDAVAQAAQAFGLKTMRPEAVSELLEGSLIDALRTVAAGMLLDEIHEHRNEFAKRVRALIASDLEANGIDVLSVSIIQMDQTDRKYFNPGNAFDAAGLTRVTERIEAMRKRRTEIETETQVQIETRTLEAQKRRFEIGRDQEYAQLAQQLEISDRRAEHATAVARTEGEQRRVSNAITVATDKAAEELRIETERALDDRRLALRREVEQRRISADLEIGMGRIEAEVELKRHQAEQARAIEAADIETERLRRLAEQERDAVVLRHSLGIVETRIEVEKAKELLSRAEVEAAGARDIARAELDHMVQMVMTRRDAETRQLAAQTDAAVERLRTAAAGLRHEMETTALRSRYDADNSLSVEARAMRIKLAVIENLESIIRESVRPLERIDGIKIVQLAGLGATGGGAAGGGGAGEGSLADQLVTAALKYRGQAPLVDALLKDLGVEGGSLSGLARPMAGAVEPEPGSDGEA